MELVRGGSSSVLDFEDSSIDINNELIRNPSTTFYGRVLVHSMKDAGIFDNDLLVIDKNLKLSNNKIAVCLIDCEFTIKRVSI